MDEAFALKDAVVSMVGVDSNPHMKGRSFEGIEGIDGICGIQCYLKLHINLS